MRMRDELGSIYQDQHFEDLFPKRGQPAEAPWRLALILIMQFMEGLTDRQAAEAVRSRIDWKYALSLELTDPGFDFSVLCEFRARLVKGGVEERLLEVMLEQFKARGLLKAGGKQRTDSTHVIAAIRTLNRLECVGETLRAALNALAGVAPDWLATQVTAEWFDRYSHRIEEYRLPKGVEARQRYAEQIGADGMSLLSAVYADTAPPLLRQVEAVDILRQVWVHQYYVIEGQLRLRDAKDLPPAGTRCDSPYDPEAHYGNKRSTTWTGYKVHVSETCDENTVHLITHVETTSATVTDVELTEPIHQALARKELLPNQHLLDTGYVDAELMLTTQSQHGVDLIAPMRPDNGWQAAENKGFGAAHFEVDWEAKQLTCPQGKLSRQWKPTHDRHGCPVIHVEFAKTDCLACPCRSSCTRAKGQPREVTLRPKEQYLALRAFRQRETTTEFKEQYAKRAGIEGTLSQGIRAFELRRSRYIGLKKTHLQHVATAAAINIVRVMHWSEEKPQSKIRSSRFAALRKKA
jgi:transposase